MVLNSCAGELKGPRFRWWCRTGFTLALLVSYGVPWAEAAGPRGHAGKSTEPVVSVDRLPRLQTARSQSAGAPITIPLRSHPRRPQGTAPQLTSPPTMEASATLTPATHAPSLNVNFRGVDDSLRFGPADPQIAVGQKHVIQAVNSLFRITDKTGGSAVTVDPVDLFSAFFAANPDINPRSV